MDDNGYDGQGKSFQQESDDSCRMLAWVFLAVTVGIGLLVWFWRG